MHSFDHCRGGGLSIGHHPEAQGIGADCGGRHAVSFADPVKKRRPAPLQLEGIYRGATPQIFPNHC